MKYKYTLQYDYFYQSDRLIGIEFSNEWLKIRPDGCVIISKGYSWNGCTFAIDTKSTYIASCVHDALYQFKIDKQKSDLAFYDLLKQNKFPLAKIYYISFRLFGFIFY